jgi:rhodanese-related sulfurtransferase
MTNGMGSRERQSSKAILVGLLLITLVGLFASRHLIVRRFSDEPTAETTAAPSSDTDIPWIGPTEAFQKWLARDGALFADIRPHEDFELSHIPYSRTVTLDDLRDIQPDEEKPLIVVTASGDAAAAREANALLMERSFPYFFLTGGLEQWAFEGKPTISFGNPNSFVDQSKVTYLPPAELKTFLETHGSPIQFLDVRTRGEFLTKHVKNALNIPVNSIEAEHDQLPVGRTFVIYGANEVEAFRAAVKLFDLNVSTARVIRGSFADIVNVGIVTETGE